MKYGHFHCDLDVLSNYLREEMDQGFGWFALEACQEAVLTHLCIPGAIVSALTCMASHYFFWDEFEVLGLIWYARNLLLRLFRAFALLAASSLGHNFFKFRIVFVWVLIVEGVSLSSDKRVIRLFSCQREHIEENIQTRYAKPTRLHDCGK